MRNIAVVLLLASVLVGCAAPAPTTPKAQPALTATTGPTTQEAPSPTVSSTFTPSPVRSPTPTGTPTPTSDDAANIPFIDVHEHIQPGLKPEAMIQVMDELGVSKIIVMANVGGLEAGVSLD